MTDSLKEVVLETLRYEFGLKKDSIKEYVDESTGIKYISGVDKNGIMSFISLDLFEYVERCGAQTEVTFDADQKVLENEKSMGLIKELMHKLLSREYDVEETPGEFHRFENKEYIKQFNKVGYALFLGNCGDPYYIDDDIGEEYTGFFMFKLVFFNEDEMQELERIDNEDDRLDYIINHYDENNGSRLV